MGTGMLLGLLGACAGLQEQIKNGDSYPHGPDVMDQLRRVDLLPRPPQPGPPTDQGGGVGTKTQVYQGEVIPAVEGVSVRSTGGGGGGGAGGEGFELTYENAPIAVVAQDVLGKILKVGYTIDPRVMGMISMSSGRPVPKSDLLFVLENALRLSGVVMVKDVQGYRLIPLGDAVGAGNLDAVEARAEPGYGVSVVPLKYVSASTLIKLLDSFATKPGTVRADPSRNLLLIQGTGAERRTAVDTVLGFDVDWMRGQSVGVFPIRNTAPEPIITELEKILDSGEGGLSQHTVKFQPITRMNAILVVTRKPDMMRTVETWIHRLDATDTARAGVHVYHVKYGDARQLARVLNDIFVGGGGSLDTAAGQVAPRSGTERLSATGTGSTSSGSSGLGSSSGTGGGLGSSSGGLGSSSGGLGSSSGGLGSRTGSSTLGNRPGGDTSALEGRTPGGGNNQPLLEGVRITADTVGNMLLIYASTEQYEIIARTLVQLDRQQLQVAIDATVAEVDLNDTLQYGVQYFLQSKMSGVPFSVSNVPTTSAGAGNAPSLGNVAAGTGPVSPVAAQAGGFNLLIGSSAGPNVVLDALHSVTNTRILNNPSIVVVDNQVATLMVGSDVPISTGSATVLTANNTVVNSIDYRSVGIILRVQPHINVNGNVRLDIEQEVSGVTAATSTTGNPTFSERKLKSSIGVQNGQTVLMAGLIQEQQETDRGGIPLLDQIPNLGDVFSHQNKTGQRTELIVFIRPKIIRTSEDASFIAEELRSKLRGTLSAVSPDVASQGAKSR
jgi:general secretion pathway protein D